MELGLFVVVDEAAVEVDLDLVGAVVRKRKTVTKVDLDLVGTAAQASARDPEPVDQMLNEFLQAPNHVTELIGDAETPRGFSPLPG